LGLEVKRIVVVPDDVGEIGWALKSCLEAADVVITTGSLGFTSDDVTLQAVSSALGLPLIFSEEALEMIKSRVGKVLPQYLRAVHIPKGSRPLYNRAGVAPGIHLAVNNKHVFILPGVPSEMKAVFEDHVLPFISSLSGLTSRRLLVKTEHMVKAEVDALISRLRERYPWAYFKTHAKRPVEISIVIYAPSQRELEDRVREVINKLAKAVKVSEVKYS